MKFAVCPHDSSKNKVVWVEFTSYLVKKTGLTLELLSCFDFECYYKSFLEIDLSYSNPLDALRLEEERGFKPVAGNDNYDEVVIVASADSEGSLENINGKDVLCVENQFATFLGMKILTDKGISFTPVFKGSWQEVLTGIAKGEADYGFLYKDFWDQLSGLSKRGVKVLLESDERLASHVIMISPELSQEKGVILAALEAMREDPEGKRIMENLRINNWYELSSLSHIKKLLQEVG